MDTLLGVGLSNAIFAAALAVVAVVVVRVVKAPPVAHFLWLLVLVRLVAPPLLPVPSTTSRDFEELVAAGRRVVDRLEGTVDDALPGDAAQRPPFVLDDGDAMVAIDPPALDSTFEVAPGRAYDLESDLPAAVPDAPLAASATATPIEATISADGANRFPLVSLLVGLWLAGALLRLGVAAVRTASFDRLVRHARRAPVSLRAMTAELAARFELRRVPEVLVVAGRIPPLVWSLGGRSRIVLPEALLARLSRDQQATLIAHELAHLRRRDAWVRWFELVVLALYWWLPVSWWARRELRQAEEHCCDAWVQWAFPERAREYARALMQTVDFLAEGETALPDAASGLGPAYLLERRFRMILEGRNSRRLSWTIRAVMLALGMAVLPWAPGALTGQDSDLEAPADPGATPELPQPVPVDPPLPPAAEPAPDALFGGQPLPPPGVDSGYGGAVLGGSDEQGFDDRSFDQRLSKLEKQMGALMAELKALRSSIKRQHRSPGGASTLVPVDGWRGRVKTTPGTGTVVVEQYAPGGAPDVATRQPRSRARVARGARRPGVAGDQVVIRRGDDGTLHLDNVTGDIYQPAASAPAGPGASSRSGDIADLRRSSDRLRAEKAALLERLADIDAQQARIEATLKRLVPESSGEANNLDDTRYSQPPGASPPRLRSR